MNNMLVAEGTVCGRERVHGNALAADELAISVSAIIGLEEISHPTYEKKKR